jgi:L-rhamnose-H+ transport protein
MNTLWMGMAAVLAGAAMQGSFGLPQKFIRGWAWEKSWLVYSLAGMIVFPWIVAALVIPDPGAVLRAVDGRVLLTTALLGAGWGVGSVLFGLGIARVGLALGFAVIISMTAVFGALIPLAVLDPGQLMSSQGALLAAGLAIVVAGVAFCSRAAALRDKSTPGGAGFTPGLLICVASGITSPMLNVGFTLGAPIQSAAVRSGAGAENASIATFAVEFAAGFLVNAGYCLRLLGKNRTWGGSLPGQAGRNTALALAMGLLWFFGFFLYGLGATALGKLGPIVGWPIFMTAMVLIANLWGLVTGEWKNADRRAFGNLGAGLALMVAALAVIAAANR